MARQERAKVPCEVESNPTDVQFVWKFNNSDMFVDIPQADTHAERVSDGSRGTASYKPETENDYGTLLCWGKNEIGMQVDPCVFFINPAGKSNLIKFFRCKNAVLMFL